MRGSQVGLQIAHGTIAIWPTPSGTLAIVHLCAGVHAGRHGLGLFRADVVGAARAAVVDSAVDGEVLTVGGGGEDSVVGARTRREGIRRGAGGCRRGCFSRGCGLGC